MAVLIVDDDKIFRTLIEEVCKAIGMETLTYPSGSAALQLVDLTKLELVIADQSMPGMTGIELSAYIQSTNIDLPFILLTGHADLEEEAATSGVDLILMKPVQPKDLSAAIQSLMLSTQF